MDAPQKQKKITVKFFLNEAVEPARGEKGQKLYPLYIQVTYNRKNMQFKSKYSLYYKNLKEVEAALMVFEEKIISSIITYEVSRTKGEYDLKGLKQKYEVYSTSILEAVEKYLKPKLRLSILKTNSELINVLNFTDPKATVGLLYKAAGLLFESFDTHLSQKLQEEIRAYQQYQTLYKAPILTYNFPTVIEWLERSYKIALEQKVTLAKRKPEESQKLIALLDQAVKESLKSLDG